MSGKPPFSGLQGASIMLQVMNNQHPKPEDHPELSASDPLWSLMRRCWDRTPEARPAMQEVLEKVSSRRSFDETYKLNCIIAEGFHP